jgi:hypothetical protein
MGLKVQRWWEQVEPMLPVKWQKVGRRVFVGLQSAGTLSNTNENFTAAAAGAGSSPLSFSSSSSSTLDVGGSSVAGSRSDRGPIGRIRRLFSVSTVLSILDALDSSFDSQMALWVMGLLAVVLWRRQTLRNRALQRQQQHQWENQPAAVPEQPAAAAAAVEHREGRAGLAAVAAAEARQARAAAEEPAEPRDTGVARELDHDE